MSTKRKLLALTFTEEQATFDMVGTGETYGSGETYPDIADSVLKTIQKDGKAKGIDLDDAVVVHKTPSGSLKIRQTKEMTAGKGAGRGAFWGLLVGLILGGPVGGILWGLGIGAIYGGAVDHGIDDKFIREVGKSLKPKTSAILMLVSEEDYEETIGYLKTFDAKIHEADFDEETQRAVEKAAENREIADAVEEEYS